MFCPECGLDHHAAERIEREAEQAAANERIEIARLETKRDIEVAKINANAATTIAGDEAAVDVAHAEGEADGMREVIDAVGGGDAPEDEAEPEGEPIVIEPPAEPVPDMPAPPEAEHHHEAPRKSSSNIFGF